MSGTNRTTRLFDWGLEGKRALITGASSGIGAQFARYLANFGVHVALAARSLDKLEQLASEIRAGGGEAIAVAMDLRDPSSVQQAVEWAEGRIGAFDILVNNAAIAGYENALDQDLAKWDDSLSTNLRGPWILSTEIGRRMRDAGIAGSIINVSSVAGIGRSAFMTSYCVSKAGLNQLTSCLALEFGGYGIRVNTIAPGIIETGMANKFADTAPGRSILRRVPLGRFGTPKDLECALLWLCSEHSSFVTGTCVVVDGGLLETPL